MDRADLSAAIIQEMEAVFMAALAEALPTVLTSDLAGMEQRLRQVGRVVFGAVVERVAAVRRAIEYVTTNAARLDYPAFMARRFPIGSGAVESSCKSLVQARTKGAGMRWSAAGAQQVVSLRALHRAGRWDAFWQSQPQRTRLLLFPRARRAPATLLIPDAPSARPAPTRAAPPPAPADVPPADAPPVPRLLRPAADHPWRRQALGRARSA